MTPVLSFEGRAEIVDGRVVRRARFERRSSLPVSAACVVANGVRETLAALVGKPVRVRLMEPAIPDPQAWAIVTAGARLYEVRGTLNDVAFILRPVDAHRLVRALFGEAELEHAPTLSPIEEEVLRRVLRSLTATLTPVCGNVQEVLGVRRGASNYVTFFEVLIEEPSAARIGIALAREVPRSRGSTLRPEDLLDIELEASAEFAAATIDAGTVLSLEIHSTLPLQSRLDAPSRLVIDGTTIAQGSCGSRGERRAFLAAACALHQQ